MTATDATGLQRFVDAQAHGVHERALAELAGGRKTGHWMWFVYPQIAGLGLSAMSRRYAIADLGEARGYLAHSVLGPRLRQAVAAVLESPEPDPVALFGAVDATKLRSCVTLFAAADPDELWFARVLDERFDGVGDPETLARI